MSCSDLLIIGAGPAGSAAALRARALGLRVVLLADQGRPPGVVESLPPAGRRLLVDLGCWQSFVDSKPTPSRGVRSVWGSSHPVERSSIRDPDGPGWHLDRAVFDAFLQAQAIRAGAELRHGRLRSVRLRSVRQGDELIECADAAGNVLTSRFLLDASGRSAAAAGRLGARRRYDDAAVATISGYRVAASDTDLRTVIEATPAGWWYSLRAEGADGPARVVGRVGDADLDTGIDTGIETVPDVMPPGVRELLGGAHLQLPPRRVAANSGYLQPFAGPRWAAAGDAALSFDPLSSQGLLTALFTGRAAAQAIAATLAGSDQAIADYARRLSAIRQAYQANLALYYGAERRWAAEPFWARRHGGPTIEAGRTSPEPALSQARSARSTAGQGLV
ncbi:NAD(P)/FAD-dependent oxidoreductase [Jatrophihabitans sp.]|uniref:NAD(P)/FAD-dependent oxidoreductase n=1 Tax=Jatrophihabitans sp. TaxID=1932789 RepID=UPI002F05AD31